MSGCSRKRVDTARGLAFGGLGRRLAVRVRARPVVLQAGHAQPADPVHCHQPLPGGEFFGRQRIARTGLVKGEESAGDRRDDLRLAAGDPAAGVRGGEGLDGDGVSARSGDLFRTVTVPPPPALTTTSNPNSVPTTS